MDSAPSVVVLGAGGHAKILLDALLLVDPARTIGIVASDPSEVGTRIFGVPVVGTDDILPTLAAAGSRHFAVGIAGMKSNPLRQRLFDRAVSLGLEPLTIVHPAATVSGYAAIGGGCQLLAGSTVNADATLEPNAIVNTGAIVEHDCRIGEHAHIGPGVLLAGGVTVEGGAYIGCRSVVTQFVRIGRNTIVDAGTVVTADLGATALVDRSSFREAES